MLFRKKTLLLQFKRGNKCILATDYNPEVTEYDVISSHTLCVHMSQGQNVPGHLDHCHNDFSIYQTFLFKATWKLQS